MSNKYEDLIELYKQTSKHSNYQVLPTVLSGKIESELEQNISRYEFERFEYIKKWIDFSSKKILDIGGNTGFFSIEPISNNAKSAHLIEGNPIHCQFVEKAAELLQYDITVQNQYYNFDNNTEEDMYDVVFNLNVIHHLGDDFGDNYLTQMTFCKFY